MEPWQQFEGMFYFSLSFGVRVHKFGVHYIYMNMHDRGVSGLGQPDQPEPIKLVGVASGHRVKID